jgi:precorrin-3B C17-methyltransferase
MAGIMLELADDSVDIEVVPGITAANAAAACLGAPLMHDYAVISLSDLLTDWELIKKRLHHASEGDFVIALYNPRSKGRQTQIVEAREIMMKSKDSSTPVGIVRNAKRDDQSVVVTTLEEMLNHEIDMFSMVIIGNKKSYIKDGKMVTPRGYAV